MQKQVLQRNHSGIKCNGQQVYQKVFRLAKEISTRKFITAA
jgi:hypothetical protein